MRQEDVFLEDGGKWAQSSRRPEGFQSQQQASRDHPPIQLPAANPATVLVQHPNAFRMVLPGSPERLGRVSLELCGKQRRDAVAGCGRQVCSGMFLGGFLETFWGPLWDRLAGTQR